MLHNLRCKYSKRSDWRFSFSLNNHIKFPPNRGNYWHLDSCQSHRNTCPFGCPFYNYNPCRIPLKYRCSYYEHKARKSTHHMVGPSTKEASSTARVRNRGELASGLSIICLSSYIYIYLWSFDNDGKLVIRRRPAATQTPIETCEIYLILIVTPSYDITKMMSYVHGSNNRFENKVSGCWGLTVSYWIWSQVVKHTHHLSNVCGSILVKKKKWTTMVALFLMHVLLWVPWSNKANIAIITYICTSI